jgi:hypothetical protein
MPLQKLQLRPGLNREGTNYSNEGGFYDGDKIRFRSGFPEKIGGWVRLSASNFWGVCRSLWNWATLNGSNLLGIGTNLKYYIENGGTYYDITPIVATSNYTNALSTGFTTLVSTISNSATTFSMVNASNFPTQAGIVKIGTEIIYYNTLAANVASSCIRGYANTTAASHTAGANISSAFFLWRDSNNDANNGDFVIFSNCSVSSVGGIANTVINGEHQVFKYSPGLDFVLASTSDNSIANVTFCTSSVSNTANVSVAYEYPVGLDVYSLGTGWGAGPWGGTSTSVTVTLGANPFTINNSSNVVTVTQTSHGMANGTYVVFSGATAVGNIPAEVLNITYQISNAATNSYKITLPNTTATSNATGGGSSVGVLEQSGDQGWGLAYYGGTGVGQQLRLWSNDNYGQDLVLAPRGGAIFYWTADNGLGNRADYLSVLSTDKGFEGDFVPNKTNLVIASAIQRFVIAFGANAYDANDKNTVFDPMLVRWSDQEVPYDWVPSVTNQSGEFRLSNGSYIMNAKSTRQEILVWTDSAIYSMQYLGPPYVWGFNILMDNISVMSPNSAITINNVTYWMGTDKFYIYSGRVETLPCALRQYIFADINKDQAFQVTCGGNEGYNEVWWFYVSQSGSQGNSHPIIDKYVIYNYLERVWYYGSLNRTSWLDSGIRQNPMGTFMNGVDDVGNPLGRVIYHEVGTDDASGSSTLPIASYVQSSDFDIGDGHNFGYVWRMLPDVNFNGSNVNQPSVTMTLLPRQNSGSSYGESDIPVVTSADNYVRYPEYTIQQFTGQVFTRLRGRQMAFKISSENLGVAWQLGSPRIDIKNDGRR